MPLLIAVFISALYAVLYHYPIVESDLFWQIRAGEEIFRNHAVQTVESWSHTAHGNPWYNFQWLATCIEFAISRIRDGYFFLPSLRSGLVGLFTALSAVLVLLANRNRAHRSSLLWLYVPTLHWLCLERLQMRPELFVLPLYLGMLCIWLAEIPKKTRYAFSWLILLLWANLHCALVPVGVFLYLALIWLGPPDERASLKGRVSLSLAGLATAFLTPSGIYGFLDLWTNFTHVSLWQKQNPDQMAFQWQGSLSSGALLGYFFLLFNLSGLVMYGFHFKDRQILPKIYRNPRFVWGVGLALFTLALLKNRMRPYPSIFILPIHVAVGVRHYPM